MATVSAPVKRARRLRPAPLWLSLLLAFLEKGAGAISTSFGLNHSFADILTGIILFFIIGCEFFISYKLSFRKTAKKEAE